MTNNDSGQLEIHLSIPYKDLEICKWIREPNNLMAKIDSHDDKISITIKTPLPPTFAIRLEHPFDYRFSFLVLEGRGHSLTLDNAYLTMTKSGNVIHLKPTKKLLDAIQEFDPRIPRTTQNTMEDTDQGENQESRESIPFPHYHEHANHQSMEQVIDERVRQLLVVQEQRLNTNFNQEMWNVQNTHQKELTDLKGKTKHDMEQLESRNERRLRDIELQFASKIKEMEKLHNENLDKRMQSLENDMEKRIQALQHAVIALANNLDKKLNTFDERIKHLNPMEQLGYTVAYLEENASQDTEVVVSRMIHSHQHLQFVQIDDKMRQQLAGKKLSFAILISPAYSDRIGESVSMTNIEKCREIADNVIIIVQLSAINESSFNINTETATMQFNVRNVLLMFSFDGKVLNNGTNTHCLQQLNRLLPKPPQVDNNASLRHMVESCLRQ